MLTPARQLFQVAPADTNNATAYSATLNTEFTRVLVTNTTGTAATFRLFHDDDGTTFTAATALYYDVSVAANTTTVITAETLGGGITVAIGGAIAVRTGTANALTFTGYGITQVGRG